MANKFSKRGKNPGAVDSWLDSLGYYRKNVAYDETCLFRAVAEQLMIGYVQTFTYPYNFGKTDSISSEDQQGFQPEKHYLQQLRKNSFKIVRLFYSQLYHERVRKDCISYGKRHSKEFKHQVPKKRDWYDRLKKLGIHMLVCSDIEIQLVCRTYNVDITMFTAADRSIQEFKWHSIYTGYQNLLVCKMSEDHYDTVYNKEYIANAGFCQSIVYKLLYEDVFNIPDVTSIVNGMLHDKQASYSLYFPEVGTVKTECSDNDEAEMNEDFMLDSVFLGQQNMLAPFPFKVAKALDPNMYRNIEYDTWLEVRRALRLGDWYYGDDKLILGTRCILNVDDENLTCYIQEILKDEDRCIVYITKLAERWTVRYSDLKPEDNAKPWPLPYRFARNLPLHSTSDDAVPADGERKSLRKRREKKRLNSLETSVHSDSRDASGHMTDLNINNYEGCPLQMQEVAESGSSEKSCVKIKASCDYSETGKQWNITVPEPLSLPWLQSSSRESLSNGDNNATSAQPPVGGGREPNNELMYYNCGQELPYSLWQQTHYVVSSDTGISLDDNDGTPLSNSRNSQNSIYYSPESPYGSTFLSPPLSTPPPTFTPFTFSYNERFMCSTPVTPLSPHDLYSFVYPVPAPGTPVVYTHPPPPPPAPPAPTPRPLEIMTPVGSPIPIYNPSEVQFVNSPTYIFPPHTPPVTWYPNNVGAQGFIFPPPVNNVSTLM